MKHLKSRFFWFSVVLGYILWAIDFFLISKPDKVLPDLFIFSAGIFVSAYILDVYARKIMPNSKSWFNNQIDK
jgi:hypothetical protein